MNKKIKNLIKKGESQDLEFKLNAENIGKDICAFANTNDGIILVGVNDDGDIVGARNIKKMEEEIANISHSCDPPVRVKIDKDDILLVIKVKKSAKIHSFKRIVYVRVGSTDRALSMQEILDHGHKLGKIQFDSQICENAKLFDIDKNKVRFFVKKANEERNIGINENSSIIAILKKLKVLIDSKLTNAAVLMFGKEPQKFFIQSKIRCARFEGKDTFNFRDMKVFEGSIQELREKAMLFITDHIKHSVYFDLNKRYDKWEYPLRAIEETITNALAHRDYFSNGEIQISIFDDRIEVTNPGLLPQELSFEDLKREHNSYPRNKLIADLLFFIKFIEKWGAGTNRIIAEMKNAGLKEPIFDSIGGSFRVKLTGPKKFEKIEEKEAYAELNERQEKAIQYIKNNGKITTKEYTSINKIGKVYSVKELNYMVKLGIIKRIGKGPSVRYVLVNDR